MSELQNSPISDPRVRQFFDRLQLSFLDEFNKDAAQLAITLKKRPAHFQITANDDDPEERVLSAETDRSVRVITYSWPGKSPYEAWKFSMCSCDAYRALGSDRTD